jgi:hypothetical protein
MSVSPSEETRDDPELQSQRGFAAAVEAAKNAVGDTKRASK